MKNNYLLPLLSLIIIGTSLVAGSINVKSKSVIVQDEEEWNPKKEYVFINPKPIETNDYKIIFTHIESQKSFVYAKIEVKNKTNDFLTFNLDQVSFKVKDKVYNCKDKVKVIEPKGNKKITLKVSDPNGKMQIKNIDLSIKGISKYPSNGKIISFERTKLPLSKNIFEKGGIKIEVKKITKETDETILKFDLTYSGNKAALIDMRKVVFVKENGEEFANSERGKSLFGGGPEKLLFPGETESLKIKAEIPVVKKEFDMQFATFYIDWKDSMKELTGSDLNGHDFKLELDWGATHSK